MKSQAEIAELFSVDRSTISANDERSTGKGTSEVIALTSDYRFVDSDDHVGYTGVLPWGDWVGTRSTRGACANAEGWQRAAFEFFNRIDSPE